MGCSKEDKQVIAQQSNISSMDQSTQLDNLGRSIVAKKCPNPISVESEHIKNRHDPNILDEIRKITCDDYVIEIYLANFIAPPKELPLTLTVNRKIQYISPSQYIGASVASVIKAYGNPLEKQENAIVYSIGPKESFGDNQVAYKIKNGLIEEITWSWDID